MKLFCLYFPFVLSHGFIYSVEGNLVRGLSKLNSVIDDLRNPDATLCRNEPMVPGALPIDLLQSTLTVKLAISKLATHIGNCWVDVLDENNNAIRISPLEKCVYSIPESECIPVPNSVTNDMCLQTWTFPLQNVNQLTCKNCVLNWWWRAEHIVPNEFFNNCIDFTQNNSNNNIPNTNIPTINTPNTNTPTINTPNTNTPTINTPNTNIPKTLNTPNTKTPNTNFNTNSNIKSLIKSPVRRPYIRPTPTDCL
jgi:hypothetical protein